MTENMRNFIKSNKDSPVYFGAMLREDLTDLEDFSKWPKEGFTEYKLMNGESFLLNMKFVNHHTLHNETEYTQ